MENLEANQGRTQPSQTIKNQPWTEEISWRIIKIKHGPDILRQGYSSSCNVLVKEAYHMKYEAYLINKDTLWDIIWHNGY